MTRRESVLISTVTVMPGVSGMIALVDLHRGFVERDRDREDEALGLTRGGRGRLGGVGGGGRVGEGPLGLFLGDRGRGDLHHLAVQHAEAGEGEGVDLDRGWSARA